MIFSTSSRLVGAVIVLLFFTPAILFFIRIECLDRQLKDKKKWGITTARLTGKKERYDEPVGKEGYNRMVELRRVKRHTDYQIEYVVDGKKYVRYISDHEAGGRKHGKVKIRYLKKRPSTFRVVREKDSWK
ncbi:hypothetical protein SAMN02910298_01031 [Pseudobutyrivibrio sp. YE44]|uniref:hypothetical protein n=1 Tax=Pseudobutyrivibrio sp. YE44 TaxID=1520802 RepID=UPI00088F0697|nr:hypothetical protein [Pseudobutyrivibrio sp. YE44]SDB21552.1 hypothetical protein SAMN02910298_01031 [Pseudobutyrivibrio sp. YE44]